MKKLIFTIGLMAVAGCTSTQQLTTYQTIATVEATATTSVDGYYALVIKGIVSTNNLPIVSKSFNDLQAAATLAAVADQNGTNGLAPMALVQEASALGTLITTIENNK